ncbi:MAG: hypothetical protein JNM96_06045, partial [Bacteroidia bacterium]|nr:hypothetical protein [Bacteroidia bacterium]
MRSLITILFTISCFISAAQPPVKYFNKYGGFGVDIGYGIKETFDRHYIIVGSTTSLGAGGSDAYLLLVDSMGQKVWEKGIGSVLGDVAKNVVVNPADSGFIFTGYTNSYGNGGYDLWLVRTDKLGNVIWQKTFGGIDWDFGNDLALTSDNHIIVCGHGYSFGLGAMDGCLLKYDLNGNLIWYKYVGGVNDDELRSVISTVDGKIATVGYTKSKTEPNGDSYFLKYELNGDTIFTRTYGGSGFDFANDLLQKPNGEYIFVGSSSSFTTSYGQSIMTSINVTGTVVWTNNFYASNNTDEEWTSISENIYNTSMSYYFRNVPVPSFQLNGNVFYSPPFGWPTVVNSFGGFNDEFIFGSASTSDGGVVCVGYTYSYGSNDKDVYMLKLDSTVGNYQNIIG